MADTTMLTTTVKNPTSSARPYGYLGYHGRTLQPSATFSQEGNLPTLLYHRKRAIDAYKRDLLAGRIQVQATPSMLLVDALTTSIKAINLSGGALGVTDPSWGAYTT